MMYIAALALAMLVLAPGAEARVLACHKGKGLGDSCVLSTVSECDTCQGLKCVNGVCSTGEPCHSGYGKGESCQLATISQCNTCLGLKCIQGRCASTLPSPFPPSPGEGNVTPPSTPSSTCVTPVDTFDRVELQNGPSDHTQKPHATPGWKSENAVDLKTRGQKPNPPVRAVNDGTICSQSNCCLDKGDGQDVYGWQFTLTTTSGQVFFYTHIDNMKVPCGASVKKGQILAYIKNGPNVDHLHFAMNGGNPCTYLRSCTSMSGAPVVDLLQGCI